MKEEKREADGMVDKEKREEKVEKEERTHLYDFSTH